MAITANRDKSIQIRVSEDEYKAIEEKAYELGLSVSNYLRMVAMHCKIDIFLNKESSNN